MPEIRFNAVAATVASGGRIWIPDHLVRRINWLKGGDALDAWLLILQPGRFRLLSHGQVEASDRLRQVLERITNPDESGDDDPAHAESQELAALAARLVPAKVSPKGPRGGWRLTSPLGLFPAGATKSGTILYLLMSEGYLELWFEDLLNRALEIPLDQVIP